MNDRASLALVELSVVRTTTLRHTSLEKQGEIEVLLVDEWSGVLLDRDDGIYRLVGDPPDVSIAEAHSQVSPSFLLRRGDIDGYYILKGAVFTGPRYRPRPLAFTDHRHPAVGLFYELTHQIHVLFL